MDINNIDDLKKELPEIHATAMKAGEDKGKEAVMANISALVKMKGKDEYKDIPEVLAVIDESIEKNISVEDTNPLIMATMVKIMSDPKRAALMTASSDSAGNINTVNPDGTVSGEPTKMSAEEKSKKNEEN